MRPLLLVLLGLLMGWVQLDAVDAVASWPPLSRGPLNEVAVDEAGNRYVVGTFAGTLDFDPRSGSVQEFSSVSDSQDVFVTSVAADGTYRWTQMIGSSLSDDAQGVAVANGTVYVTGTFSSTNLGIGGAGSVATSSAGSDVFVAALDATSGAPAHTFALGGLQRIGGTATENARAVAVAGGTVYVTGNFLSSNLGIGGVGTMAALPGGYADVFIAALDAVSGSAVGAFGSGGLQRIGGSLGDFVSSIALANGRVYVVGDFSSSNLGIGGAGGLAAVSGPSFSDAFVAALDATLGTAVATFATGGVQRIGGSSMDSATAVAIAEGVVYIAGNFYSSNLGIGGTGSMTPTGTLDAFVAALDGSSGVAVTTFATGGVQRIGGTAGESASGVVVTDGTIHVLGSFSSSDLGIGGVGGVASAGTGSSDVFVAAMDAASGAARASFSVDGVWRFGGTLAEGANGIVVHGGRVTVVGSTSSTEGTTDGISSWVVSDGFTGFMVTIDATTALSDQVVTLASIPPKAVTAAPFTVSVSGGDSGNPVVVTSSNPAVATVSGTTVTIHGVGTTQIIATQAGDETHAAGGTSRTLTVVADGTGSWPPLLRGPLVAVAVDADGNRYATGTFTGTQDFDPRPGSTDVLSSASNSQDVFVTSVAADGTYRWTQVIGGASEDSGDGIVVVGGVVYVAGSFQGSDLGIGGAGNLVSVGSNDTFVAALDGMSGAAIPTFAAGGVQRIGGTSWEVARGLAVAGGTVYVTGYFQSTNLGIGGAGSVSTSGAYDAFVAAVDATSGAGVATFAAGGVQRIGGSSFDYGSDVVVANGVVYVVGSFSSSNLGIGGLGSLARVASDDAFVAALDAASGLAVTTFATNGLRRIGGSAWDSATDVAAADGKVYVTGSFQSSNLGIGDPGTMASTGLSDAFVAALDATSGLAVTMFASDGLQRLGGSAEDLATGVVVAGGRVYASGSFKSSDFGIGGAGNVASMVDDAFVVALDAASGDAVSSFSGDGVWRFGGAATESAAGIAVHGDKIEVVGTANSIDGTTDGISPWSLGDGFTGFLATIDATTALPSQLVTLAPIPPKLVTAAPFTVIVSGGASGNPVLLSSSNPAVATVSGTTVTIHGVGTTRILATQDGDATYLAASASRILTVVADASGMWPPILRGPVTAVAVDADGNQYVTGNFSVAQDFDPRPGSVDLLSPVGNGADAFVTSMAADGAYRWTQVIGGSASDGAYGVAVVGGTVYVTGSFQSADLGIGGAGSVASVGANDVFVAALDTASGAAVPTFATGGVQRIGGSSSDFLTGIVVADGTVYLAGTFQSSNLAIGGAGSSISANLNDGFIAALDAASGVAVTTFGTGGLQRIGGSSDDYVRGMAVANGSVYVSGYFYSSNLGIGGLGGVAPVGPTDAYVAALDATSGQAVASFGTNGLQQIGGSSIDQASQVAASDGVIYVAGSFASSDLGIGGAGSVAQIASGDVFVAALDGTSGAAVATFAIGGVQRIGGSGGESATGIATAEGTVYVMGTFNSTNLGIGSTGGMATAGSTDVFVAALDAASGAVRSSFSSDGTWRFGGSSGEGANGICVQGGRVNVVGSTGSTSGTTDGGAAWTAGDGFTGFLVNLDATGVLPGQVVTMAAIPPKAVTAAPFTVSVSGGGSGNPVLVHSSNPAVATVSGTTVTIHGLGTAQIIATQAGDATHAAGSTYRTLTVIADASGPGLPLLRGPLTAVAVDADGNRYVTGTFTGIQDFDPRAGFADVQGSAGNSQDVFITSVAADGTYRWTQVIGGSSSDSAGGIAVAEGKVYVAGSFQGSDLGIGGVGSVVTVGSNDVFVAVLDASSGTAVTAFAAGGVQRIGGTAMDVARGLTVVGGTLYVTGTFQSSNLGIGGAGAIVSAGGDDAFVAALDVASGAPMTNFALGGVRSIGGTSSDSASGIAVKDGTIYVVGMFQSSNFAFGGPGWVASSGSYDGFAVALDAISGAPVTSFAINGMQRIGGSASDSIAGVSVVGGIVYVVGTFSSSNLGIGSLGSVAPTGSNDVFVAALDAVSGVPMTSFATSGLQRIGGASGDVAIGLAVTTGMVYVLGNSVSANAGIGGAGSLQSLGGQDVFVACVDATSGAAMNAFATDGLQLIGGANTETAGGIALTADGWPIAVGSSNSLNLGVGGVGSWNASAGWNGFMVTLPPVGVLPAIITVASQAVTFDGVSHHSAITSQPNGLPMNVTYNGSTTPPTAVGIYSVVATSTHPGFVGSGSGTLTINPVSPSQAITFPAIAAQEYGQAAITLNATASSGLSVIYTTSDPSVATITGSTLSIVGAGSATITATQPGNTQYTAAIPVPRSLTVSPAALTVTAISVNRALGVVNPALTWTIAGFVNGDDEADLDTPVSASTTAHKDSPQGIYPITPTGATDANYTITFTDGQLRIYAFEVSEITITGTVAGGITPTVTVAGNPATMTGATYSGTAQVSGLGVHAVPVTATSDPMADPGNSSTITVTVEQTDVPLGGG